MRCFVFWRLASVTLRRRPHLPATPVKGPMAHAVDQLFGQRAGPDLPGASIAIIENGKIIYSQGYGAANLEYGVPNSPGDRVPPASVSKQFTASRSTSSSKMENCPWTTMCANTFRSYTTSAR